MEILTIGFTKKSAETFFELLRSAGVERLVDVRRNNTSQLAGFAKRDDLAYLLDRLVGADYEHCLAGAPPQDLLTAYRSGDLAWDAFAETFRHILVERRLEAQLSPEDFERPTVLLCSEPEAEHCHRRLVVEHLAHHWGDVTARHL